VTWALVRPGSVKVTISAARWTASGVNGVSGVAAPVPVMGASRPEHVTSLERRETAACPARRVTRNKFSHVMTSAVIRQNAVTASGMTGKNGLPAPCLAVVVSPFAVERYCRWPTTVEKSPRARLAKWLSATLALLADSRSIANSQRGVNGVHALPAVMELNIGLGEWLFMAGVLVLGVSEA